FYRINTMEITLPPLRDRKSDILPLAKFLLDEKSAKYKVHGLRFDDRNLEWLERYPWPGNIRELENKIERAVILNDNGILTINDLDVLNYAPEVRLDDDSPLGDLEKHAIQKALVKHSGNISKTADELGLSRAALYRRMEKYRIEQKRLL
ncbi:MAG: sigma-54-dependent Fis family transcriptional regulator, partial [Proteobacteria bacterium]